MDRVSADYFFVTDMIKDRLKANPLPLTLPIGEGEMFNGIIDLLSMKAILYNESTLGSRFEYGDIPSDLLDDAEKWRHHLIEEAATYDDGLMEKYLADEEISIEELKKSIRKGCLDNTFIPIFCGSAFKNKGVQRLLDAVVDFLPTPEDIGEVQGFDNKDSDIALIRKPNIKEPFSALAFKIMTDPYVGRLTYIRVYSGELKKGSYVFNSNTGKRERISRLLMMHANKREDVNEVRAGEIVAAVGLKGTNTGHTLCEEKQPIVLEMMEFPEPVIEVAVEPVSKADQDALSNALVKLTEEDPTFRVSNNADTGQTIISGMGELHLEILIDRMLREFKVKANVGKPQVTYIESITKKVSDIHGKFIRQSGGRGQYGHVVINVEPSESGKGYCFINKIVGGAIPREFISAVDKGIQEGLQNGILAGFPIEDVSVELIFGSYHDVDSSEIAFKIAGSMAVKEACKKANPILKEPIMKVEITTPNEYLGDVVGDINSRRGKIESMDQRKNLQAIMANVPLAQMFGYATVLRSLTQGRAVFHMDFSEFKKVPARIQEEIIEQVSGLIKA